MAPGNTLEKLICEVEREKEENIGVFSPETKALIEGLSDSPESMQLKVEILQAANELKRGPCFFGVELTFI